MTKRRVKQADSNVAVAYLRASTREQKLSPEAQRASIEAWAARDGVSIVAWFADSLSGATDPERRPGLMAALAAVREHNAGLLVVAKRDRLARDRVIPPMLERQHLMPYGARLRSAAGEGTDSARSDDPDATLQGGLHDLFAEHERGKIRQRTRDALAVKKARGERVGRVPFGWRVGADGKRLELDPGEQAVIARIELLRASGLTQRSIAAVLAAEGVTGRSGRSISQVSICLLLRRARTSGVAA